MDKIINGGDLHTHGSASISGSGQTDTNLTGVGFAMADALDLAHSTIMIVEFGSLSAFATLTEVEPASPVTDRVTIVVDVDSNGGEVVD